MTKTCMDARDARAGEGIGEHVAVWNTEVCVEVATTDMCAMCAKDTWVAM